MPAESRTRTDLRRRPQQRRSRANVEAILDAAEALVTTEGIGSLTTTRVAEGAGVAVGTVYQYFPGVDAIADCLTQRCAEQFAERLGEALAGRQLHRKRDAANAALDSFVEFHRTNPLLRALRPTTVDTGDSGGAGASSQLNAAALGVAGRRILAVVSEALTDRSLGDPDDPAFVLELEIQWAVAQALVPLAFGLSPDGEPAVLDHLRRLFDLDVRL